MTSSPLPFERRAVTSLAALYAFRMLGLFMILPVLSLYGDEYTGSTPLLLGVALGAYGFSQAFLQIPFGMLSDRWGRKPVILSGLAIFALGSVIAALSESIWGLIIGRFLQGGGAIASAIMALVADLTSEENRTKAMASIGASIGLSFSLALVLGPLLAGFTGLSGIFWLTAGLAGLGAVILLKIVPSVVVGPRTHRDAGAVPELFVSTLKKPELLRLNVGIFSLHFILMACFLVTPLILSQQHSVTRDSHWQIYLPLLVAAFVVMVPFVIVAEKYRRLKPVFLAAIALLGCTMLALVWWQQSWWLLLFGLFLFFVAFNLLEASLPSLVSKLAPAGAKGTASGIYATCQFAGTFLGGVAAGLALQWYGVEAVFVLCAGVASIWLLVALGMQKPRYLTSVCVPLARQDYEVLLPRLQAVTGVEEVLIIAEESAAYLKVDARRFDRNQVNSLVC